jgi:decaprenyl-phosphate phosphoribosyltransferase
MSTQPTEPRPPDAPKASAGNGKDADSGPTPERLITESRLEPRAEGSALWRLSGVVMTVRPHQWVKNVFVLAPVAFAKELFDPNLLLRAGAAFAIFCMLAGAIYTINDIADIEADRQHPVKRFRPIPSGRVPIGVARVLAVLLIGVALVAAAFTSPGLFAVAAGYFVLNIAYSLKLKHVAYLDVGCIAAGFVLRVVGGGSATHIQVSSYLLLCTALLALFLGFGKRRHELAAAAARAGQQRLALESYSKRGLDIALGATALTTIITYLAYTLDEHTRSFFQSNSLWVSTVFVMLGVLRFLHLVRSRPRSESPTQEMLKDGPFVLIVLLWTGLVMWVVYNLRPS